MQLTIRGAIADDRQAIFSLWHDPEVLKEQYPLPPGMTVDSEEFRRFLAFKVERFRIERRTTSILVDGELVGVVIQNHWARADQKHCLCGWNLAPSHWGRGIMPAALALLFDKLFRADELASIIADCFTTNTRCLRVLDKLGFERERLGLRAALAHFRLTGWSRRVRRHRLTAARWLACRAEALERAAALAAPESDRESGPPRR